MSRCDLHRHVHPHTTYSVLTEYEDLHDLVRVGCGLPVLRLQRQLLRNKWGPVVRERYRRLLGGKMPRLGQRSQLSVA